jgi:hypothetical protein
MSNAGDGDKRKVSTDALETLGTIIGPNEKRDAIHLAVCPAVATVRVFPGQDVNANGEPLQPFVGIVDPFLKAPVQPSERFWLVIYPRMIHSLRHVWTHPSFADEAETVYPQPTTKDESMKWIKEYADGIGLHWSRLLDGADEWVRSKQDGERWGEYLVEGGTLEGTSTDPEFWKHYEIVRGITVPEDAKENFFSCSC